MRVCISSPADVLELRVVVLCNVKLFVCVPASLCSAWEERNMLFFSADMRCRQKHVAGAGDVRDKVETRYQMQWLRQVD